MAIIMPIDAGGFLLRRYEINPFLRMTDTITFMADPDRQHWAFKVQPGQIDTPIEDVRGPGLFYVIAMRKFGTEAYGQRLFAANYFPLFYDGEQIGRALWVLWDAYYEEEFTFREVDALMAAFDDVQRFPARSDW
ncbi:hypothetical protein [Microvirga aerophila]|uniref:Uncharacterized protein n=1 Tax=Microvirga aerophila TaxID=670291 RepID=A0A512BZL5_9HYPH|nr:hypothetical protein [Microvirga aerophila]GEO17393.1 hypothetical protein MAE02_50890 [Microvirga aerophila]